MSYIKGSPDHWTDDMTDTVTVYKASTLDSYGKRTTSASGQKTYACRIISDILKQNTDQNRIVYEEGKLIILGEPDIGIGDRIVLPNGKEPIVKMVDIKNYNANGTTTPHHAVIAFGRA